MHYAPLLLRNPVLPPAAAARGRAGSGFWTLIFGLITMTGAMVAFAVWNGEFQTQPRTIPFTELARMVDDAAANAETETIATLDRHLDAAFAPVYAGIPVYADFHYSVLGEYTLLTEAALGRVSSSLEQRLFHGFQPRIEASVDALNIQFDRAYSQALSAELSDTLGTADLRFLSEPARITLEDAKSRATVSKPINLALSILGARAGVRVVKVITRTLSRKVLVSIGRKTAAKAAARGTGIGSGAGAGAAAGAIFGPPGAVAGGIIGGVASWIAVDYAVISIDAYFNRAEFEIELRTLVDVERDALRSVLLAQIAEKRANIRLAGRTPDEILSNR